MVLSPSRGANCHCCVCLFAGVRELKNMKLGDKHERSRSPISSSVTETHVNSDKKPCLQERRRLGYHRFVGGQTATGPGLFDPSAPRCGVVMSGSGGWRVRWSVTASPSPLFCRETACLLSVDAALCVTTVSSLPPGDLWRSGVKSH